MKKMKKKFGHMIAHRYVHINTDFENIWNISHSLPLNGS